MNKAEPMLKRIITDWLIPFSLLVCFLSIIFSNYVTPAAGNIKTPTKAVGVAILELIGISSWGGSLSTLIKPSLIVFVASVVAWILLYPKDFFQTILGYFKKKQTQVEEEDAKKESTRGH